MNKLSKQQLKVYSNLPNYSDIETVGFEPVVHTTKEVHVLANIVVDPDTGEEVVLLFHDRPDLCGQEVWDEIDQKTYVIPERVGTLMEGFRYWYQIGQSEEGFLSVHNAGTFDKIIVEKVVPKCLIPNEKWDDTFISSKIQFFDRPCPRGAKSGHGLNAYGILHGIKKPDITDFTVMDKYMLHRVIEDCKIQRMTALYLDKERRIVEHKTGITFDDAYKMEFEYALTCAEQERFGAAVDLPHMQKCVEVWDERLHFLEDEIEPRLPPTVKSGSSTKITRKEMAVLMGFPKEKTDRMKEPTITRKQNGEDVEVKLKPYVKPVTKWTNQKTANKYSGMHISYGFSPSFLKKKDLTDWIKEHHDDTAPKDWEIEKEEVVTELVNAATCKYFDCEPEDLDLFGGMFTKVKFEASRLTQHEITKGVLIKAGLRNPREDWNLKKDDNGVVKATEDMVVSYPPKAAFENQLHYHIKKGEAVVTSPKFCEKDMDQVEGELGKQVSEYNTLMHRRRFLSNPKDPDERGLIANIREDGRIPCGVGDFMTATGRAAHRVWVNAPGAGSAYGEEVRRCIVASKGKKLVSSDMNSAQLSIAAYYANNYEYFKAVCYGNEFKVDDKGNEILHPDTGEPWYLSESGHCTNSRAFELFSKEESDWAVKTQDQGLIHKLGLLRKKSKSATFGVIFGCSGKKLATMLGIEESRGKQKKDAFLANIGLDRPIEILDMMCEKNKRGSNGIIELPFGFFATCKSPHARFNYLDQGTEAACQKWAELYFDRESKKLKLAARRILSYHDEYTVECPDDEVEIVKELMNSSYYEASLALHEWHRTKSLWFTGDDCPKFNIELNAGCKVGTNYWEVH